jgi:hypothetical protein
MMVAATLVKGSAGGTKRELMAEDGDCKLSKDIDKFHTNSEFGLNNFWKNGTLRLELAKGSASSI